MTATTSGRDRAPRHIVIVGAGYAGATAARTATWTARSPERVTLVSDRERIVERVRLHQVVTGHPVPERRVTRLASRRVAVVVDPAVRIRPPDRQVELASGRRLEYDALVLAVGSISSPPPSGSDEDVTWHSAATTDDALRLRSALLTGVSGGPVTVVGGGLTGLEVATQIAGSGRFGRVRLVTSTPPAPWLTPAAREHLRAVLPRLGVDLVHATVRTARAGVVVTDEGEFPAGLLVWAGGFAPPPLLGRCGLHLTDGWVSVDTHLRSISAPDVFVAGDAAVRHASRVDATSGPPLRRACQTAVPTGATAALNALRTVRGAPTRAHRMRYVGINLALGPRHGLTQVNRFDDTPRSTYLTGRPAQVVKEVITRAAAAVAAP